MEKYRDLIVTLIKNHRKYEGCESILDDIVEDVYNHAQVVLQTVSNSDVIASYLAKIVSTSMITVPKKMGIARERKTTLIMPETPIAPLQEEKPEGNKAESAAVQITGADLEENSIDSGEAEKDEAVIEEVVEPVDDVEIAPKNDNLTVDKGMVDKLINGISPDEEAVDTDNFVLNELDEPALENPNNKPDDYEDINSMIELEGAELSNEETTGNYDSTELIISSEDDELLDEEISAESNDIVDIANIDEVEPVEENLTEIEPVEPVEYSDDEPILDDSSFEIEDEPNLELEELNSISEPDETGDLLSDLSEDNEEINLSDGNEEMPEVLESDTIESGLMLEPSAIEETSELSEAADSQNTNFTPPSFSCFEYTPENTALDKNELIEELLSIDKKHPEKQIITVCKLKYNEHKSVEEISSITGLSADDVLEDLNDITYITKDL